MLPPGPKELVPPRDAAGRGRGRKPELTLVPGGGVEKGIFVDGWGALEIPGHTVSLGRWGPRLSAGGGKGNGH